MFLTIADDAHETYGSIYSLSSQYAKTAISFIKRFINKNYYANIYCVMYLDGKSIPNNNFVFHNIEMSNRPHGFIIK